MEPADLDDETEKMEINPGEIAGRVRSLFGKISGRYDLANHVMSLGVDRWWRRVLVRMSGARAGESILDMCCGTGDVVFAFAKYCRDLRIVGCDFSEEMIELARSKKGGADVEWCVADCSSTDFQDGHFDVVSCAFGVRNFADLQAGLREMNRVLKIDGRACIVEFSLPPVCVIRWVYLLYFKWVIPVVGGIIGGDMKAYRYLSRSVLRWDRDVDLMAELMKAGFGKVAAQRLSFGIATVYIASK